MLTDIPTLIAKEKTHALNRKALLSLLWDKGMQEVFNGPRILCCGEWQPMMTLPHTCPRCKRTYFVEEHPCG